VRKWTILAEIWTKNASLFAEYTIKRQAILMVGMDGHPCTRSKEKQQSAARQWCIQKWAFLGVIWSKNDQSF
jgi:hypothetical protein